MWSPKSCVGRRASRGQRELVERGEGAEELELKEQLGVEGARQTKGARQTTIEQNGTVGVDVKKKWFRV